MKNLSQLRRRKHYKGFDYRTQRARELTGAEWLLEAAGFRIAWNGDCWAVYRRAELLFEFYLEVGGHHDVHAIARNPTLSSGQHADQVVT